MKNHTTNLSWWNRIMTAVTFAEANEAKAALTFLTEQTDRTETRSTLQQQHVFSQNANVTARVN